MFALTLISLALLLISWIYIVEKKKANYWTNKGIAQVRHVPIVGILLEYMFVKGVSLGHVFKNIYDRFPNESCVGCFFVWGPTLILRDPNLLQYVLRTEFNSFHSRGVTTNWEIDKLADNVLFMEGTRWKLVRQRFTPVFTSGKLRSMFYIINESGKEFENFVEHMQMEKHNLMNILATFTQSSIGASVFGIDADPKMDFNSPLHRMARETGKPNLKANLRFVFSNYCHRLFRLSKMKFFGDHEDFFVGLIKKVLKERRESGLVRHDFIDNCLEIQKEKELKDPSTGYTVKTTDELMAGQAFFYFIAGVDPTATVLHFALYELSQNPSILQALHGEIDAVFLANNDLTYEIVDKMEYVEKVISESMRKYPPIPNIQRKATADVIFPNGLKIEKGTICTIPILAIHHDPKYYPEPEVFDPERFTLEAVRKRPNYTYIPFGEGNRICIGMRYVKLQIKTGLVHLLRVFTMRAVEGQGPPMYDRSFFGLRADNLKYEFVRRQNA